MASLGPPLPELKLPQAPDMMGDVSKLMALRSMMNQQQVQQQQIQAGKLENEQHQMDVDSQKALQKAYREAQGDPDKTEHLAAEYGAKPTVLLDWRKAVTAQKLQAIDLVSKQGAEAKRQADLMQGAHDQIAALSADKRAAAWPQALQQLTAEGVDVSKSPQQYPGDDAFQMMGFGIKSHTQMVEEALKSATAGKENAQASEATATAEQKRLESAYYQAHGGAPGVSAEIQQQNDWIEKQKAAGKNVGPSDYKLWVAQHSPTMLVQGNFGQAGDPLIDLVGRNQVDLATALQRVGPGAKDTFLRQLSASYPNYNQGAFGVEKKATEAFTSGAQGQQLTAIDTAREHMKTFSKLADALDNNDTQLLNKIGNAFGVQFGSDKATNLRIASQAFGGEVGRAFDGAGVIGKEREQAASAYADYLSKGQFKGAIETVDKLLEGKQTALKRSYDAAQQAKPNFGGQSSAATKTYQGHTYEQQSDGSWKLKQ